MKRWDAELASLDTIPIGFDPISNEYLTQREA